MIKNNRNDKRFKKWGRSVLMCGMSLYVFIFIFPICLFGQKSVDEMKKNVFSNPFSVANQNYIRMMESTESTEGLRKYFLLEDWGKMVVQGYGDLKLEVDSANYIIPDDKVYFIDNGQLYHLYPGQVERLAIGYRLFSCFPYESKNKERKLGYFEILVDGDIFLLKKYFIQNKKVYDNPLGLGGSKQAVYQDYQLYYYEAKNKFAIPIPKKKGEIISLFGRKRSKMIEFARKRELSLNSEQDVRLLFAYYNMMVEAQSREDNN